MRFHRSAGPALIAWLAFALGPVPADAGSGKPKVKTVKTNTVKSSTPKAPKVKTQAATAKSHAPKVKTARVDAKGSKATRTQKTLSSTPGAKSKTKGQAAAVTTGVTPEGARATPESGARIPELEPIPLNKAQQQLTKNTNLRLKLESRLPAGTDVIAAASGFRNLGQFVAAVNASSNQGFDFTALKTLMTGPEGLSLGQAKQRLQGTPEPIGLTPEQQAGRTGGLTPEQQAGQTGGLTPEQIAGASAVPGSTPETSATKTKNKSKKRTQ
jgi:hypothetical protein